MNEKEARLQNHLPITHDGATSDTRKLWTTPQLRTLPVIPGTQGGVQPQPKETTFYLKTS